MSHPNQIAKPCPAKVQGNATPTTMHARCKPLCYSPEQPHSTTAANAVLPVSAMPTGGGVLPPQLKTQEIRSRRDESAAKCVNVGERTAREKVRPGTARVLYLYNITYTWSSVCVRWLSGMCSPLSNASSPQPSAALLLGASAWPVKEEGGREPLPVSSFWSAGRFLIVVPLCPAFRGGRQGISVRQGHCNTPHPHPAPPPNNKKAG